MKPTSDDLSRLIGAAETEVSNKLLHATAKTSHRSGVVRYVWLAGAVVALVIAATQLAPLMHIHGSGQTIGDLDAIIEQARQVVEAARVAEGRLPDTLPNAALAGVVAYTPVGNSYRLFSASAGVSVTLEMDGRKTVKQGTAP
jgi:hypothetical protein